MICLKCQEIIKDKDCLEHPSTPGTYYCPKCKHVAFDFGKEFSEVSTVERLDEFDKDSGKFVQQTGDIHSFYDTLEIDTKIIECQDTLKISPKDVETRVVLGKLYFAKKDYKNALKEFLTANELCDGFHYEATSLIAQIYATIKTFSKALHYSKIIQKHDPKNIHVLMNIANCYYSMKKYKETLKTLKLALKIDPDNEDIKETMTQLIDFIKNQSE